MDPGKLCVLDNEKLVNALNVLVKELRAYDSRPGFRTCNSCRFGGDNSLTIFDFHCQFESAYDALSNISGQLEELSKLSHVS
jgi:hypothetical protein